MSRHPTYAPPGNPHRLLLSRSSARQDVDLNRRAIPKATEFLKESEKKVAHWDLLIRRADGLTGAEARRLVLALTDDEALSPCAPAFLALECVEGSEDTASGYMLTADGRKEAERLKKAHPELSTTPRPRGAESGA